jgi:EmrB/QacA subfamily drug resistance transporter
VSDGLTLKSRAGRWVLTVTVLGSGMAFLDGTIVNVALPDIGRDLNASTASLQWILNGYLLSLASLILLGGSLGDRYGRRRIYVIGIAIFTVASLLCAVAPNSGLLIAARLLEGVGAALLTPGSLAMIEATFSASDRPRAIGAWSGLSGVAGAIGPILGGYLVEAVSWRAVFLLNLPLGAFVAYTAYRHLPETRDPDAHGPTDVAGASLGAVGLAGTTYALIEGPAGNPTAVTLAAIAGLLALMAFAAVEYRGRNPMVPLSIFSSREFDAANLVTFAAYGAGGGFLFLFVSFLQISLGYSPLEAGAATVPLTLISLVFSARSGALAQRIGPRIPLTIGMLLLAAGLLLLTGIEPGDDYVTAVLPSIIILAAGIVLVGAPVTATAMAAADPNHAGVASGINNAVARVSSLLAVALLPLIAGLTGDAFYDPSSMTDGFHVAMYACAVLVLVGGVIAWLAISDDVLKVEIEPGGTKPTQVLNDLSCPIPAPPLRPGREAKCKPDVSGNMTLSRHT